MLIVKFIYSSLAFMLKYYYLLRNSWKFSLYTTVIYSKIVGTVCVGCLLESSVLAMGSIKVWIVLKVLCVCLRLKHNTQCPCQVARFSWAGLVCSCCPCQARRLVSRVLIDTFTTSLSAINGTNELTCRTRKWR